jgi:hypothetical protein
MQTSSRSKKEDSKKGGGRALKRMYTTRLQKDFFLQCQKSSSKRPTWVSKTKKGVQ